MVPVTAAADERILEILGKGFENILYSERRRNKSC